MVGMENLHLTDPQFGNPELEEIIKLHNSPKKAKRSVMYLLYFQK